MYQRFRNDVAKIVLAEDQKDRAIREQQDQLTYNNGP